VGSAWRVERGALSAIHDAWSGEKDARLLHSRRNGILRDRLPA